MNRHGKTAQEFIQLTFSPMIAVLRSYKVDNVMSKNNLSFVELLQPFATLNSEGQFREPNGTACVVKNWKLIFRDVNWKPLQPTEARRQLNNAVLRNYDEKNAILESGGSKYNIPHSTPWFECWRETYFEVQFPSDHEFTKHFLSCLLVGTSQDENIIDSFNALNQELNTFLSVTPPKLPKWFNNNILKSFVLLHDVSCVPKEKAESAFDLMKQNFGAGNCFMLHINSRSTTDQLLSADFWIPYIKHNPDVELLSPTSNWSNTPDNQSVIAMSPSEEDTPTINVIPQEASHPLTALEESSYDNANSLQSHSFSGSVESVSTVGKTFDLSTEVHGAALNAGDVESIKKFVQEYAFKALLPYIERQVAVLSEAVANRKGVSRSLLSATKRWFGGKAPTTTGNNTVVYSSECPELQLRRLGDLWFMCGQWHRAFDTYHTAKREFYADSAWLCYAGALEMAALSAFMAGEANQKTNAYMEESIVTYLNTCRMVQYAVRATLLSSLCLTTGGFYGEAAKQLIRMTSEDSDLRSAMLLEQAAMCFISGPGSKAMARKYAFHMVLAGHRFSKAGQKKHAYRCYKHAYEVYENSGWRLATDHVQFALGRLASSLKCPQQAVVWLAAPLAPGSPQPPEQHLAFLRDYMLAYQQCRETLKESGAGGLSSVPLPLVCRGGVRVCVRGPPPLAAAGRVRATDLPSPCWPMLEQMAVQVANGNLPLIFTPTINLFSAADNNAHPVVPKREPIQISITIKNPLKVSLLLKDIELLWRFLSKEDPEKPAEWINNEEAIANGVTIENNVIFGQKIKSLYLEGEKSETINFSLTPLQVGQLIIQGLAYRLISGGDENGESKNSISIYGKLDLEQASNQGTPIKCLDITVIPCAPCLQMTFSDTSSDALSGEIRYIDVEFRNVGPVGLKNLHVAVSHPDCMHLYQPHQQDHLRSLIDYKFTKPPTSAEEGTWRSSRWRGVCGRHVSRVCEGGVAGGAAVRATLLLRPRGDARTLCLLAYYEPEHTHVAITHRLLRHVFTFQVTESVEVRAVPRRGVCVEHGVVKERMNIGVEVEHLGAEGALAVEEVALAGEQWALRRVHGPRGPLSPRHRAHLLLTATRHVPRHQLHVSALSLAPSPTPTPSAPLHLLPLSHFLVESHTSLLEDEDYVTRDPDRTPGLIHSMLVVRWTIQTTAGTAYGHHCLWINCFSDDNLTNESVIGLGLSPSDDFESKTDLTNNKSSMVIMTLDHEKHVNHDFEKNKLCVVPVTVNIVNCHNDPVEVHFDFTKKSGAVSAGWVGCSDRGRGVSGGGWCGVETGAVYTSPHCLPLSPPSVVSPLPVDAHHTLLHLHQRTPPHAGGHT